ncbi:MAG: hypothetical protein ACUVV0_03195 [Anaerolineae bacterium]
MNVTRAEMLWALKWALVALILTSLPYLWAWSQQTEEFAFTGLVYDVKDCTTYLAEMHQGAEGEWLLHLPFTSEEHPRALVHALYLILGKVAALFNLPMLVTYHLARVACGLLLLIVSYLFVAFFIPYPAVSHSSRSWRGGTNRRFLRRLAFLLIAFSNGLGWVLLLAGRAEWQGDMPIDFWVPEAFTMPIFYGFPHISLATALLLGSVIMFILAIEKDRCGLALLSGALCFFLGFVVPFNVPIVYAAVAAYLAALALKKKELPRVAFKGALLLGIVSAPSLLYNFYVFTFNPAFREWTRQNLGFSPHPLHYLLSYALLSVLALGGAIHYLKARSERGLFLVSWIAVALVLIYAPFNLQRRLIAGVHPSLSILASIGFARWVLLPLLRSRPLRWLVARFPARYSRRGLSQWLTCGFVLLTIPSNLLLMAGPVAQSLHHEEPIFQPQAVVEAADWLKDKARPREVILSSPEVGNYIPARSGRRVFIGHPAITARYEEKKTMVEEFFAGKLGEEGEKNFLRENDIAYVFYGPRERALGDFSPQGRPYLRLVYRNSKVEIYKVENRE